MIEDGDSNVEESQQGKRQRRNKCTSAAVLLGLVKTKTQHHSKNTVNTNASSIPVIPSTTVNSAVAQSSSSASINSTSTPQLKRRRTHGMMKHIQRIFIHGENVVAPSVNSFSMDLMST